VTSRCRPITGGSGVRDEVRPRWSSPHHGRLAATGRGRQQHLDVVVLMCHFVWLVLGCRASAVRRGPRRTYQEGLPRAAVTRYAATQNTGAGYDALFAANVKRSEKKVGVPPPRWRRLPSLVRVPVTIRCKIYHLHETVILFAEPA